MCEGKLVSRSALKTDNNTGQRRFAGNFFGCSNYGKGCEAEYSVGLNGNESYYTDEASAAE